MKMIIGYNDMGLNIFKTEKKREEKKTLVTQYATKNLSQNRYCTNPCTGNMSDTMQPLRAVLIQDVCIVY